MEEDFQRTDDHLEQLTKKWRYVKLWKFLNESAGEKDFSEQIKQEIEKLEEREKYTREQTEKHRTLLRKQHKSEMLIQDLETKTESCQREIQEWQVKKQNALIDSGVGVSLPTGLGFDLTGYESIEELEAILGKQEPKFHEHVEAKSHLQQNIKTFEQTYDEMLKEEDVFGNKENHGENCDPNRSLENKQPPGHNDCSPLDHCTFRLSYLDEENHTCGSIRIEDEVYEIRIQYGVGVFGQVESIEILTNGSVASSLPAGDYLQFSDDPEYLFAEARQEAVSCHFWQKHCTKLQTKFQCLKQTPKSLSILFPSDFRVDVSRRADYGTHALIPLQMNFSRDPPDFFKKPFYSLLDFISDKQIDSLQNGCI